MARYREDYCSRCNATVQVLSIPIKGGRKSVCMECGWVTEIDLDDDPEPRFGDSSDLD
jgi:hypothetical protein